MINGTNKIPIDRLPKHIAIIMDGNGRWAVAKGVARIFGHRKGAQRVREITEYCSKIGIKVLTLYAFSTENWSRPKTEISGLMIILKVYLKNELKTFNANNIRFNVIGNIARLSQDVQDVINKTIDCTSKNSGLILTLALNYGGRDELVRAYNGLFLKSIKKVDEAQLSAALDTAKIKIGDPDLIIRTSGEMRVSNFLLWQCAYCEFYFTKTLWPDFTPHALDQAISDYRKRHRKYGGI